MFHLVFSGPEQDAAPLVEALTSAGYPSQLAEHHGFAPEPLTLFVEALGHPSLVDDASRIAGDHRFVLRLHGIVEDPDRRTSALEARLAELEARLAQIEGTS